MPTSKRKLLDAAKHIIAAHTTDWDWPEISTQMEITGSRLGLAAHFVDGLMAADSVDSFRYAYVQFVVNVSDLDAIRAANHYLRDQAGASLVPSWATKHMDRRPGSGRHDRSHSRNTA